MCLLICLLDFYLLDFIFNPIQDGFFQGCSRGAKRLPLHKICHIYPAMMKVSNVITYLKRFQKIYESRDTLLDFWWHFFTENQRIFAISKNTDVDCVLIHNL